MKAARQTDVLAKLLEARRAAEVRAAAGPADRGTEDNLFVEMFYPKVWRHGKLLARLAPRLHGFSFVVGVEEIVFSPPARACVCFGGPIH